ncbi:hypothetical protein D3C75_873580 [compost metagenome]
MGDAHLHAVAQAYGFDAPHGNHRVGEHCHGIGVVQEPRIRTNLLHIRGKIHHHRDGAQIAEDPPDAQRIGNGLAQPVFLGHLEIRHRTRLIAAYLNGIDHILGSAESLLPVGIRFHTAAAVQRPFEIQQHILRVL